MQKFIAAIKKSTLIELIMLAVLCAGASPSFGAAIIADHQAAANFSNIPSGYFSFARSTFNIYYGHTSHGSQIITGMSMLENENANYGLPPIHETGPDLGYPTWEPKTREYLDEHPETNLVMWSWCGQLSGYGAEKVNDYLTKMSRLEADYPNVTFIYMTGHLNRSGPSGTLYANNNLIRSFCRENSKILFDFADIESYDPDGNYYPDGGDACEWCSTWCNSHVCPSCDHCAHSHCFNCYLKGKAFWWLLARLSGWNLLPGEDLGLLNPTYRFWCDWGDHFYTISEAERDYVINNLPCEYEGIAWYAYSNQQSNTLPVYRFWCDWGDHFYTISEIQRDYVINNLPCQYEGIAWYAYPN